MMHSSVVVDGHDKILEENFNLWEQETMKKNLIHCTQNLRRYYKQWNACYIYRRVKILAPIVKT